MLPRWRPVSRSIALGEASPEASKKSKEMARRYRGHALQSLELAEMDFARNPSAPLASEVVAAAVLAGEPQRGKAAARFMVAESGSDNRAVRICTEQILDEPPQISLQQNAITRFRQERRFRGHDGLSWLDLALAYASCGNYSKAERALTVARHLVGPDNRLMVRAEVRFFQHVGDPDRAINALRRQGDAILDDPWMLAPEIGMSTLSKKSSRFASAARKIVRGDRFHPFDNSELCAAVATLEMINGAHKPARHLFGRANRDPVEQVVAQTVWARDQDNQIAAPAVSKIKESAEALTRQYLHEQRWRDAISAAQNWVADEPFASTPGFIICNLKSTVFGDYLEGMKAARQALDSNPNRAEMLNSFAYAAAMAGELAQAKAAHSRIDAARSSDPISSKVCAAATAGLIAYCEGDPERGRALYAFASRTALSEKREVLHNCVAIFQLRTALAHKDTEVLANRSVLEAALKANAPPLAGTVRKNVLEDLLETDCPPESREVIARAVKRDIGREKKNRLRGTPTSVKNRPI